MVQVNREIPLQVVAIATKANNDGGNDCGTVTAENQQQVTSELGPENSCVSTPVLGGVVGVLVTVLVVLVIGWSLSCVALVKRNSHIQKQTIYIYTTPINKQHRSTVTAVSLVKTQTARYYTVMYSLNTHPA